MKHTLNDERRYYANAKKLLASINRINAPIPETRSLVMGYLNRKRGSLLREMKRVAWLLWPKTGRPGE